MVPGSTLRYWSSLRSRTRYPRACNSAPSAADARPLPREETTPPVMKMYRAMGLNIYPAPGDSTRVLGGLWIDRYASPACRHFPASLQELAPPPCGRFQPSHSPRACLVSCWKSEGPVSRPLIHLLYYFDCGTWGPLGGACSCFWS